MGPDSPSVHVQFDSDEFKYTDKVCYITVEALEKTVPEPSGFPITVPGMTTFDWAGDAKAESTGLEELNTQSLEKDMSDLEFSLNLKVVLEDDLIQDELRPNYESFKKLFKDVEGGRISQNDRKKQNVGSDKSFTYGEIKFISFVDILKKCDVQPGEVFYDLGCGTGKGVVAAYYAEPFSVCHGVELLDGL